MKTSLIAILIMAAAASAQYHNVTIKNLRLFDGNTEFFIKSICYSPAPAGYAFGNPNEGSGVCKLRTQYRIDANNKDLAPISACFYEDFFDGSVDPSGDGNREGWFKDIWTRDIPAIAATGANVIRFYHSNPITRELVFKDAGYKYKGYGSDYVPFMNAAAAAGLKVVFPLFAEQAGIVNFPTAKMEEYIRSLVDNVGNHPALLMWQFGNELPVGPNLIPKLNHFFDYARSYTFYKWQRHVPVSIALVDLPSEYNNFARDLKVDIITTNAGYRGPGYSDLWTGNGNNFDGLHSLSCQYGKPVFIGEIGQHSTDGFVNMKDWFPQNWDAIIQNYKNGAIGGALFEYSDESWKAENQRSMGIVHIQSDTQVTLKQESVAYNYDAVKQAFSRNIFSEMGRAPYTLDNVDNSVCSGYSYPAMTGPIYPLIDIGNPDTTPVSTYTSDPAPSSDSGSGSGSGGAGSGSCGAGLSQCGAACYKSAEYCCAGTVLYPAGNAQCTATPSSTTSEEVTPTPSSNTGSSTGTPSSNSGSSAETSSSSGTPSSNSGSSASSANSNSGSSSTTTQNNSPSTTSVQENTPSSSTNAGVDGTSTQQRDQGSAATLCASAVFAAFVLLAVV